MSSLMLFSLIVNEVLAFYTFFAGLSSQRIADVTPQSGLQAHLPFSQGSLVSVPINAITSVGGRYCAAPPPWLALRDLNHEMPAPPHDSQDRMQTGGTRM